MTAESAPDEIERRLAETRSVLEQDLRALASDAREWVDWRNHFRAHPWLYCGAAVAIGFTLVPHRRRLFKLEAKVVSDAGDDNNFVLHAPATVLPRPETLLARVLKLATTVVVGESINYLTRHVKRDY